MKQGVKWNFKFNQSQLYIIVTTCISEYLHE